MSNEPKVTRFGADPTVDQELATKAYVDGSSGGGSFVFAWRNVTNLGTLHNRFTAMAGGALGTSEVNNRTVMSQDFTWSRITVSISSNGSDGTMEMLSRINAADGNQTLTVPIGTTGEFQDTTNTDSVLNEDLIDYRSINAGTGNIQISSQGSVGTP